MSKTRLHDLLDIGQSPWIDSLSRSMIDSGELQSYLDRGITGVTSNPTIFDRAISQSDAYEAQICHLVQEGYDAYSIYEALAVADIQRACDLLRPVFDRTDRLDGYVSLEISPFLAYSAEKSLIGARRLFSTVDRPNVMIKIPGTPAGIQATAEALYEGINVNVTLLFSIDAYQAVIDAYLEALERRLDEGEPVDCIASVASFFVSRVDTEIDRRLQAIVDRDPESQSGMLASCLIGTVGISNARVAYHEFVQAFQSGRFERLREAGARVQRPLWASTSTKNPDYPANLYTEALIGPDTVNTMTADSIESFLADGKAEPSLSLRRDESFHALNALSELGISYPEINQTLVEQGLEAFAESFRSMLNTLESAKEEVIQLHEASVAFQYE
ncbi:MAG: transaldolase [Thermomicrobiales bacterium]